MQIEWRSMVWRYWAVSWVLVVAGLAGWEPALYAATALTLWQVIHFRITEGSFGAFAVQVRIAVFLMFAAGLWLRPLYWLPAFGLFARITFNYCLTARALSLLPWNRKEPLTAALIRRTFLSPPTQGGILPG